MIKVVEAYDGRLPYYNVVREVSASNNCNKTEEEIIGSFESYEEADLFADTVVMVEETEK